MILHSDVAWARYNKLANDLRAAIIYIATEGHGMGDNNVNIHFNDFEQGDIQMAIPKDSKIVGLSHIDGTIHLIVEDEWGHIEIMPLDFNQVDIVDLLGVLEALENTKKGTI